MSKSRHTCIADNDGENCGRPCEACEYADAVDYPVLDKLVLECQKCDGIHDHQLKFSTEKCSVCRGPMVTVARPTNG